MIINIIILKIIQFYLLFDFIIELNKNYYYYYYYNFNK